MVIWMTKRHYYDAAKILKMSPMAVIKLMKQLKITGCLCESKETTTGAMIYQARKNKFVVLYIGGTDDALREFIQKYYEKLTFDRRTKIVFYIKESQLNVCEIIKEFGGIATHCDRGMIRMVLMLGWHNENLVAA